MSRSEPYLIFFFYAIAHDGEIERDEDEEEIICTTSEEKKGAHGQSTNVLVLSLVAADYFSARLPHALRQLETDLHEGRGLDEARVKHTDVDRFVRELHLETHAAAERLRGKSIATKRERENEGERERER